MLTNRYLKRMYRSYNKRYFKNKLPPVKISFEDISSLGMCDYVEEIVINKKLKFSPSLTLTTLLHEMVHLNLPPKYKHGPKFDKEIRRLFNAGAYKGIM